MIHERATLEEFRDPDVALVPLTRSELQMLVDLWAYSDTRYVDDLSVQLKAAGALAQLDFVKRAKRRPAA